MNKKETKENVKRHWLLYHIPSMSNIHRIKRDAIFVSNINTFKHELAKSLGAIMIKRFGDVKFNDKIIEAISLIDKEIATFGFTKNPSSFLTEAERNLRKGEPRRRVDLINLVTGDELEFETNHKILKKEGAITILI